MRRAAFGVVVIGLGLSACTGPVTTGEPAGTRWNRLHAALDTLGAAGDEQAARAWRERHDPRSGPAWWAWDLAATERQWATRAARPESVRSQLAAADDAALRAASMLAHDSLAAAAERAGVALAIRERWLGADAPASLRARDLVGQLAFRIGRTLAAESLAVVQLAHLQRAGVEGHPLEAGAESLRGRVLKNYGGAARAGEALASHERALVLCARAYGDASLEVADVLQDLGNLHRHARRTDAARDCFERALDIRRRRLGAHDPSVASAHTAIAYLEASLGRWADCARAIEQSLNAQPAESLAPAARTLRVGLLGQAQRRLGRLDEAVVSLRAATVAAESTWARSRRDAQGSVQSGLSIHRELAMALAARGEHEAAFESLERGQARLWADVSERDPWHGLLPRVQAALPHDAAIVAWVRSMVAPPGGDFPLWACVVRSAGPVHWVRIERGAARRRGEGAREALARELMHAAAWPVRVLETDAVEDMARDFAAERFAPLSRHLEGVRRVVVVGPDMVSGLPLGLLPDADGRRLDERFVISYAPSALAWLALRGRADAPPQAPRRVVLAGAPGVAAADSARFPYLAAARAELLALAAIYPEAEVLTGGAATASALRRLAARRPDVLHLATHADPAHDEAMRTTLVLAPEAASDSASRISAAEVARSWRLDARVVSLATCHSALGLDSASEGWLGLQHAFLAAGARSVLVSRWQVEDAATARLMHEFHAALLASGPGEDAAAALQRAQQRVRVWRDPEGRTPYAHPAYWAGFVLVGSGE